MSDLSDIRTDVRRMVGDFSTSLVPGDIFTYVTSAVFTLSESAVSSISAVLKNDVALADSGAYTYSSTRNQLTVITSLTAGDTVEIQYAYYPNYTDTELNEYIKSALTQLSVNRYYTFLMDDDGEIHPDPRDTEKNLIAFITAIIIEPENKTYRLPDLTINVQKSMPTNDLIRKAIAIFKKNTSGVVTIL